MMDYPNSNRPEIRSAVVSKELLKFNINIVALSEVRFAESGSNKKETGYTFYWSRKTLTKSTVNLVWLLRSAMVFCQMYLRIPNQ